MINVRELEEEIKKIIEPIIKGKIFPVYKGEERGEREIDIYIGSLPPDSEKTIIPAITIRVTGAKNTLEQKKLSVLISIGIFSETSEDGYLKICNLTQEIFEKLMEIGVINNRFEILPEAEWNLPEAQPYPYFLGFIDLNIVYEKDYRKDLEEDNKEEAKENFTRIYIGPTILAYNLVENTVFIDSFSEKINEAIEKYPIISNLMIDIDKLQDRNNEYYKNNYLILKNELGGK